MSRSLYVIAGETSGDAHAAELVRALRARAPDLELRGFGGPKLAELSAGGVRDWIDRAAVMGVVEVLKHYSFFKQRFAEMLEEVTRDPPRVLLLVDYPGFNLRFAAAVRRARPEVRIVQYVCPQVWAWKKGRIRRMVEVYDEVLCLLPFEPELFEGTRLRASFVGHPMVDELERQRIVGPRDPELVALMPGSREPELRKLFPMMLESAERLRQRRPRLRFEVPAAGPRLEGLLREMAKGSGLGEALVIRRGGAHELMQRASCGVIASGTATVEAAYFGLPYCLVYRLAWFTYLIAKLVVRIERIGLVNILAGEELVEEFVQSDAEAAQVEPALARFIEDPGHAAELGRRLVETTASLGGPGAGGRAAERVAAWFEEPTH